MDKFPNKASTLLSPYLSIHGRLALRTSAVVLLLLVVVIVVPNVKTYVLDKCQKDYVI